MPSGFWSRLTYAVVEVKRWPAGRMRWSTEAPPAKCNGRKVEGTAEIFGWFDKGRQSRSLFKGVYIDMSGKHLKAKWIIKSGLTLYCQCLHIYTYV